MKLFIVKALWHSTSKLIKIKAKDEFDALDKASKNRSCKGCSSVKVVTVR